MILSQQNVLWLDISVEDSIPMHVVDTFNQLIHIVFHSVLWEVVTLALDGVVEVHVHEFKNESKAAGRLIVEYLVQRDDVGMWR